jgi:hypothetical protein
MPLPRVKPVWLIVVSNGPLSEGLYQAARGGLDVQAFCSKKEAEPDLYRAKQYYRHAKLVQFVPVEG